MRKIKKGGKTGDKERKKGKERLVEIGTGERKREIKGRESVCEREWKKERGTETVREGRKG